ncbi:hypothetical protein [Spiroplasma endosymbiont of Polydrusus formosus]|uniref:hypothetical protein n=1 Tax=Spiroplasma endosymbiont of Polydrusus formosus TaxID=3139326 RepID=UPI0035B54CD7
MEVFYNVFKDYKTKLLIISCHITEPIRLADRYKSFATARFNAIYNNFYDYSIYVPNGSYQIRISYVTYSTKVTINYGSSKYKHWGIILNHYLLTAQERQIIESNYAKQLAIIQIDYAAFKGVIKMKKLVNISDSFNGC